MDVFELRNSLIGNYRDYVTSFMAMRDPRIRERVESALADGRLWPEPRIGLDPAFEPGGWVDELVDEGLLHEECKKIFRVGKGAADPFGKPMRLHRHQVDAIREAKADRNYVLTTGTGSGKSLAYIVPIVDHVLHVGSGGGVKAIVVYPMNALANSQERELAKFLKAGYPEGRPPVRFARYTGQEGEEQREAILRDPPDIILTNYVMLELILTRVRDRKLIDKSQGLKFLVLDELHTYRGRQGADVALLVRRLREACTAPDLRFVGTSATLSTEGSYEQRQASVARMASQLFGSPVEPRSIVGETLRRATRTIDTADAAIVNELRQRVRSRASDGPTTADAFMADPLSSWIEDTFGIREVDGRLTRVTPGAIGGDDGGAAKLARLTGDDIDLCATAIRAQLMAGFAVLNAETGFPVFAFRLHQFISKGDTVFASPEPEATRHLTLNGQRYVPGHREKVLLPLSFCRQCGQEYYTVHRLPPDESASSRFVPRDIGDRAPAEGEPQSAAGFLYVSTDAPWPADDQEVIDRLPEDWLEEKATGLRLKTGYRKLLPVALRVDPGGQVIADGPTGTRAWFVPAPFRLCLRCGVSYGARIRSDLTKLTTLGSEGRSTATTVLSLSAVRALRTDADLAPSARKLLSFTDNRQDASLQAGHFNDFVQVALLRGAIHRAVADAGPDGLEHDGLTAAVFHALDLPFDNYANDPEVEFQARRDTDKTLREVLGYHLYLDLRRGWRITQPNLEQVGLLHIDYPVIDEVCAAEHVWNDKHPALADATPAQRKSISLVLLDYLRRDLAIDVDYLNPAFQERLLQRSGQRLQGQWALDEDADRIEYATVVLPRSRGAKERREWSFLSSRSGFGQYLRRKGTFPGYGEKLKLVDTEQLIIDLLLALKRGGLVEQVLEDRDGVPGYQVPATAMVWRVGDGTRPYQDPIRMPTSPEGGVASNQFFVDLYRNFAHDLIGVEAREHTAQVRGEVREQRERDFRSAKLPVMYCSPTMELGVDIADLNVVSLRNVPPTPANYAQRSGRAGRSGQPALVFTYCSVGSPHDQYFFRKPQLMVAGQVSTPRLDLANEDLVRAHIQAVWLAASGVSLGRSLTDILDVREHQSDAPLQESIAADLANPTARINAKDAAARVLADVHPALEASAWWSESWLDDVLNAIPLAFEEATARWRGLFRSAHAQFDAQNKVVKNAAASHADKNQAKRLRREAETQIDLLTGEDSGHAMSDFNSYRYFASEGFLPGYSFPRLPLSAFIPAARGHGNDGEFLSRPRFLAISEFGPRSLVYHEGQRYEINKVILPVAETTTDTGDPVITSSVKRCDSCGYLHPIHEAAAPDLCENCHAMLSVAQAGMFRLHNVSTRRRDRINSDEEERQRQGFELYTGYRFAERNGRRSMRLGTIADSEGNVWGDMTYGETATLWRVNLGRRRRVNKAQHGFILDVDRGYWKGETDDEPDADPVGPRTQRVIPYVEDSRNCLVIEPHVALGIEQMASLESALKNAIQTWFQLEDDELASEPLPTRDERRSLLFYESAEGGAGVLRRLVAEPDALAAVARRAIELCHVDPVTGIDQGGPAGGEPCEAACYDCLMSYRNQLDHEHLDRTVAIPVLQTLAKTTVTGSDVDLDVDTHLVQLHDREESPLEAKWLEYLREHGHRLPDQTQVYFEQAGTRPDYVYSDKFAVVYVDGPHHDFPERQARDHEQETAMRDLGYRVIRFGHADDWAQITSTFSDVFGEAR